MPLSTIAKSSLAALAVTLVLSQSARALDLKAYDDAQFKAAQAAGKSLLIDVHAVWCPTCKAQAAVLEKLKDNPAYKDLTVYRVDYDKQVDAVKAFGAKSQSTLIAFKGAKETGRAVGQTKPEAIEQLLATTK